jgi:hypothetical protein
MFICNFCQKSLRQIRSFIDHLKEHFEIGQIKFPFKCNQNCQSQEKFLSFESLNRHLRLVHGKDKDENSINHSDLLLTTTQLIENKENEYFLENNHEPMELSEVSSNEINENFSINPKLVINDSLKKLEKDIFNMVIKLKAKFQLSETLLNEIIDSFSSIYDNSIEYIISLISNTLNTINQKDDKESLINNVTRFKSAFKFKSAFNYI